MTCSLCPVTNTSRFRDAYEANRGFDRSFSSKDLRGRDGLRRSYSDNRPRRRRAGGIRASVPPPKLKINSTSIDLFNNQLTLKSFLSYQGMTKNMDVEENHEVEINEGTKRANWIERLMELGNSRKERGRDTKEENVCGERERCGVEYEEDADGGDISVDRETFSSLLERVLWSDAEIFSRLAFLCKMAYAIPDIKTRDLRRYYGLEFVTSSLDKKAEAAAIKDTIEQDSIRVPRDVPESARDSDGRKPRRPGLVPESAGDSDGWKPRRLRPSAARGIAASAASFVRDLIEHQQTPDGLLLRQGDDNRTDDVESSSPRICNKSEMAAYVAASTMTAAVAAGEKQKEEAAGDRQSPRSSPCEWFVCDDPSTYTRCFVIQGSDSLASWQANLLFEPARFEGRDVLVHRGIYEAAERLYGQFMPEIKDHLNRYGDRAKLRFTGHSLGGSLALLVNLMLLTRKEVQKSALLPVVSFGSPFVFCGGRKILDQLNLDEEHVHSVMMHRDIVPRAFSCTYPTYVARVLKRLNSSFHFHPCLNRNKLLYSPMGKVLILQPDENSSPPHPLLPPGSGLYALDSSKTSLSKSALRAFLNSPHPIETLSDPTAYGSEGTIIRDHDSGNYLKAVNEVMRQTSSDNISIGCCQRFFPAHVHQFSLRSHSFQSCK